MPRYSAEKSRSDENVRLLAKAGLPAPPMKTGQLVLKVVLRGPNPDPQYADWFARVAAPYAHEEAGWLWWDNRDKAWKPSMHGPESIYAHMSIRRRR